MGRPETSNLAPLDSKQNFGNYHFRLKCKAILKRRCSFRGRAVLFPARWNQPSQTGLRVSVRSFLQGGRCAHQWVTGDCYLIDCPEFCNKFITASVPTLDSLRKAHPEEGKTTCRFVYSVDIMSLGLDAVHVKLLHSCPTLWDPMDHSLPGSSVHRILQSTRLKWIAISFLLGIFLTQGSNPCLISLLHW